MNPLPKVLHGMRSWTVLGFNLQKIFIDSIDNAMDYREVGSPMGKFINIFHLK